MSVLSFIASHKVPVAVGSVATLAIGGGTAYAVTASAENNVEEVSQEKEVVDAKSPEVNPAPETPEIVPTSASEPTTPKAPETVSTTPVSAPEKVQSKPAPAVSVPEVKTQSKLVVSGPAQDKDLYVDQATLEKGKARRTALKESLSTFITSAKATLRKVSDYDRNRTVLEQCLVKNQMSSNIATQHVNNLFDTKTALNRDIGVLEGVQRDVEGALRVQESKVDQNKRKEEYQTFIEQLEISETSYTTTINKDSTKGFTDAWNTLLGVIKKDQDNCSVKELIRLNDQPLVPQRLNLPS